MRRIAKYDVKRSLLVELMFAIKYPEEYFEPHYINPQLSGEYKESFDTANHYMATIVTYLEKLKVIKVTVLSEERVLVEFPKSDSGKKVTLYNNNGYIGIM